MFFSRRPHLNMLRPSYVRCLAPSLAPRVLDHFIITLLLAHAIEKRLPIRLGALSHRYFLALKKCCYWFFHCHFRIKILNNVAMKPVDFWESFFCRMNSVRVNRRRGPRTERRNMAISTNRNTGAGFCVCENQLVRYVDEVYLYKAG